MFRNVIVIIFCSFIGAAYCQGVEQVSTYTDVSLSGNLKKGQRFDINISLSKYDCSGKDPMKLEYWGIDGYCPATFVKQLNLLLEGKDVKIPQSFYNDLANVNLPSELYLMQLGNDTKLYLSGGDGVASYSVVFVINSGKVVFRSIEYMNSDGELATEVKKNQ